jgi:hypothetical protein
MQRRMALVLGTAGGAVLLLAWVSSADRPPLWRELSLDSPSADLGAPPTTVGPPSTRPITEPLETVDIAWLANATLVLIGAAVVVAVVWWLSQRRWNRPARRGPAFDALPEIAPDELLDAADDFDVLIRQGSARNAIVACWVRLEEAVEQAGLVRNPAETPTEMTTRVLRAYAVDAGSIGTLTTLYREARFSAHDMNEGHRRQAQDALADIRHQLRAAADRVATGSAT